MRRLVIRLGLFLAVIEGLRHVDLMVLIAGGAVALAVIVWSDLILA